MNSLIKGLSVLTQVSRLNHYEVSTRCTKLFFEHNIIYLHMIVHVWWILHQKLFLQWNVYELRYFSIEACSKFDLSFWLTCVFFMLNRQPSYKAHLKWVLFFITQCQACCPMSKGVDSSFNHSEREWPLSCWLKKPRSSPWISLYEICSSPTTNFCHI